MPKKKRITHGISFPEEEILNAAKQKAASMQISFSTYVNQLIRKDLGRSAVFDWSHESDRPRNDSATSPRQAHVGRFKEASPLTKPDPDAK